MSDMTHGDIDGDGQINAGDMALLRQVLQQSGHDPSLLDQLSAEDKARLDVNRDGLINQDDIQYLCEIMLKSDQQSAKTLADRFKAMRDSRKS